MFTQAEFNDIMLFFEQQFATYPYKFLNLLSSCELYKTEHPTDSHPKQVEKELEEVFIRKHEDFKLDTLRRMNAIYRFQIFLPKKYHQEFLSYGIQVGENGRVQEFHWSDTIYFGEPMRENVTAYLEELSSTSLRFRTIGELANGYEKWREATLNLRTPIEVKPYLYWRIKQILEDVMSMENLSDSRKVTILMLTGTPITKEFRNRLNEMEKVITDEEEKIVFFKEEKESDVELQQSYSHQELGIQQLPIVPAATVDLKDVSSSQILQYLEVLQKLSENETVPLSDQEIEIAYNESVDEPRRIQHLAARIRILNDEIFNFDEMLESSRIKMLFATQTSINSNFRERMKNITTPTGLNLDESERIIKFQSNEPGFEMELERELFCNASTLNPVPWGAQEIRQFFDFFDAEALTAATTLNLQTLCVKYKNSMDTKRSWAQLYDKFHNIIIGNMDNVPWLEYIRKAYILFAFGISPHPELLRKFYKKFAIQLNSEQKIIFCDCHILKDGFGKKDDSRPLSRPSYQKNYTSFVRKTISGRNDPMTKDELVDEFLSDYPHFDTRENVKKFFGKMDYKFLKSAIKDSDSLLHALFITQIRKPTNAKKTTAETPSTSAVVTETRLLKPRSQKRERCLTPPYQSTRKNYRSRPRGEPRVEQVEERPSKLLKLEKVPENEEAHQDLQHQHQNYDDYEFYQGNNEEKQMEIGNSIHEDGEQNNQIRNESTGGDGLLINHIQADDQPEIVTGIIEPDVSKNEKKLIESQEKTNEKSNGDEDSTVSEEVHSTETNCSANNETANEKVAVPVEDTSVGTDNGASVSETATSVKNCPLSQPTEHLPVPPKTTPSRNHASNPGDKSGAPTVEKPGKQESETVINEDQLRSSDGTSQKNSHEEEETYDRKEAMRLVFRIYDSIQYNSEIEKNAKKVKNMYKDVKNGERISMKPIIEVLKKSLEAIEGRLCFSEEMNNTNSCIGDVVFVLFRQMAKSLESSQSEEIIQLATTLENKTSTQRIEIDSLIGVLRLFFLELFTLPAIGSEQEDNN